MSSLHLMPRNAVDRLLRIFVYLFVCFFFVVSLFILIVIISIFYDHVVMCQQNFSYLKVASSRNIAIHAS